MNMSSCSSIYSPASGVVIVLDFGHSNRCIVVSPCFNLQFPIDIEHIFICLFAIYMSYLVRCLFRSFAYCEVFVFLLLSFKSSL